MQRFRSWDGTGLAYRLVGSGPPLVCVPGGPGQAAEYLGELGGLSASRTLVLLDNRGTGSSDVPADPATYRVDRIVDDVEALRAHLGLDRMDLFGHSASGGVIMLYAAQYPERLNHLVVVAPSLRVVGIQSDIAVAEVLAKRAHESWHAEAVGALTADAATAEDLQRYRRQAAPLLYGQWTAAARAHAAAEPGQFAQPATDGFYAGFKPDPSLPGRLRALSTPTLLIVGEYDIWPTAAALHLLAPLFDDAELMVLSSVGHFPWVDDPATFTTSVERFLANDRPTTT